jgi:membrane-associated HD superfamily phosphohydrolase
MLVTMTAVIDRVPVRSMVGEAVSGTMVMVVRDRDDSVTRSEILAVVTQVLGLSPVGYTAMAGQVLLNDTDIDMLKVTRRQSTKTSRESFKQLSMTRRKQRKSVRGCRPKYIL